jgi:hypothetical protein
MNVLQVSATSQILKCAPRSTTITSIVVIDQEAGTSATINAPTIINYGYYIGVQAVYSLKAGRFYIVQLYNLTNFLGSEQVWCYKASLQTDEHSSNNDFVML